MSIKTAPKENRPMLSLEQLGHDLFNRISELIDPEQPIEVYRNLHKKCWSVRQRGKVKLHTDYICLENAEFKVSQKGRERVLKEKRKNVHAVIKGFIVDAAEINKMETALESYGQDIKWVNVTYNPYKYDSFVTDKEKPIKSARYVDMCTGVDNPVMVIEKV